MAKVLQWNQKHPERAISLPGPFLTFGLGVSEGIFEGGVL